MGELMSEINVRIPAQAEYMHVLRSVVAGVAARQDLSVDDIEDLRLAVGEACAYLLAVPDGSAEGLQVRIVQSPGQMDVIASVEASGRTPARADPRQTVVWHILAALTDAARLEETPTGPAIRLTKLVPVR
jgi:serine/threonine-protein kinase RsbW